MRKKEYHVNKYKFDKDLYGPLKHVAELCAIAEEVRPHPVHHAPVLQQVVLGVIIMMVMLVMMVMVIMVDEYGVIVTCKG